MARMTKARMAEQLIKRLSDPSDLNYDVPGEIVRMLKHPRIKTATKVDLLKTLLQYTNPKQKAIEIEQNVQKPITFNVDLSGKSVYANAASEDNDDDE